MAGPPGPREARPEDKLYDPTQLNTFNTLVMAGLDPATHQLNSMRKGYVYLLASQPYGTLYIGVTNNLSERIHAHRIGKASSFTRKYKVTRLVWWEEHVLVTDAIQRESNMKKWKRNWKIDLVNATNPKWLDLYEAGGLP